MTIYTLQDLSNFLVLAGYHLMLLNDGLAQRRPVVAQAASDNNKEDNKDEHNDRDG